MTDDQNIAINTASFEWVLFLRRSISTHPRKATS
jgi:hypothetical protein